MGVSISYQALPADCELLRRLDADRPFARMIGRRMCCGGLFNRHGWFREKWHEDCNQLRENDPACFPADPASFRLLVEEAWTLIQTALDDHPGIESRGAWLEKSIDVIEPPLISRLASLSGSFDRRFVERLLLGEAEIPPPRSIEDHDGTLGFVSHKMLDQVAPYLRQCEPEDLFPNEPADADWPHDGFRAWRDLYLLAAKAGDDIILKVC